MIPQNYRPSWRNAETESVYSINASIANKTAQLDEATALLKQATDALAKLSGYSVFRQTLVDVKLTGRNLSTWVTQRDKYAPLVAQYKKELSELLTLQATLSTTQQQVATSTITAAAANKAIAEADIATTTATASKIGKYILIAGVAVAGIIGAVILFKKLKNK
jgi:hypothetical protein